MENLFEVIKLVGLAIIAGGLLLGAYALHVAEKGIKKNEQDMKKNFVNCPDCVSPLNKKAKVCLACGWRAKS